MNSQEAVRRLAEYAVDTRLSDLPGEVLEHARRVLLDTVGVILAGSTATEVRSLAERLGRPDGGPSTILGTALRTTPMNATLVNGTAATWLDFDSGHRHPPGLPLLPAGHPPVHMIPPSLALAEQTGASGAEVLVALVVGYDVGGRIGVSSRVRGEIHPHGTYPNVSAAVAAARLMGADARRMERTIGLSANLTLLPSFENAYQGCTVRNSYSGVGGMAGLLAAQLAVAGFTPERDAVGTVFGGISSPWLAPELLVERLGERYEITQGYIKPYPCCRYSHPAIEAARGLLQRYPVAPDEIERIQVRTYDLAATLSERKPATGLAAKFSIPYCVATMLVRRSAGPGDFTAEAVSDPMVRAVAERVDVVEDPAYTAMTPEKRPAKLMVHTAAGGVYTWEVDRQPGGPDAPLLAEEVLAKYRSLAEPVVGSERAVTAAEMIARFQELRDVRELTGNLVPPT